MGRVTRHSIAPGPHQSPIDCRRVPPVAADHRV